MVAAIVKDARARPLAEVQNAHALVEQSHSTTFAGEDDRAVTGTDRHTAQPTRARTLPDATAPPSNQRRPSHLFRSFEGRPEHDPIRQTHGLTLLPTRSAERL